MRDAARFRSLLLAVVAVGVALPTLLIPGVLTGPDAMNGSARGTALVIVLLAVPTLVLATRRAEQARSERRSC
jgi:hypothetical protein